LMMLNRS